MRVLFIGAHHDDIEIAAGGTAAKLVKQGHDVQWLILTDEEGLGQKRRSETVASARRAGVLQDHVFFFEARDGSLRTEGPLVAQLRAFAEQHGLRPELILTHSADDSHNDHQAAHALTKAAFRQKIVLCYHVVNSGITTSFTPQVYVDTTSFAATKRAMLECHESQIALGRIKWNNIREADSRYRRFVTGQVCEPFSLHVQEGAAEVSDILAEIDSCRFTSLWRTVLRRSPLTILVGRAIPRVRPTLQESTSGNDVKLAFKFNDLFRSAFHYRSPSDLQTVHSTAYDDEPFFARGSVMIIGGSASNNATLRIFNHLQNLRYIMGHSMPYYERLYIYDTKTGKSLYPESRPDAFGQVELICDLGLLSVLKNPYLSNGVRLGPLIGMQKGPPGPTL